MEINFPKLFMRSKIDISSEDRQIVKCILGTKIKKATTRANNKAILRGTQKPALREFRKAATCTHGGRARISTNDGPRQTYGGAHEDFNNQANDQPYGDDGRKTAVHPPKEDERTKSPTSHPMDMESAGRANISGGPLPCNCTWPYCVERRQTLNTDARQKGPLEEQVLTAHDTSEGEHKEETDHAQEDNNNQINRTTKEEPKDVEDPPEENRTAEPCADATECLNSWIRCDILKECPYCSSREPQPLLIYVSSEDSDLSEEEVDNQAVIPKENSVIQVSGNTKEDTQDAPADDQDQAAAHAGGETADTAYKGNTRQTTHHEHKETPNSTAGKAPQQDLPDSGQAMDLSNVGTRSVPSEHDLPGGQMKGQQNRPGQENWVPSTASLRTYGKPPLPRLANRTPTAAGSLPPSEIQQGEVPIDRPQLVRVLPN